MVGNDAKEDGVAKELGIDVFLLTDCLLNKDEIDISKYKNGDLDALENYLDNLPSPK